MPELLYSIEYFNTETGQARGAYGPAITIARPLVEALLKIERKRDETLSIYQEMQQRLLLSLSPSDRSLARLDFLEDTWLLLGMYVGDDCACFGVGSSARTSLARGEAVTMRYSPHNIDTREQAGAIVSTWLFWFNTTLSLTDFSLPFSL